MALYTNLYFYTVLTPQGERCEGYTQAPHRFAIYQSFQALGWDVLRVRRSFIPQLYYTFVSPDNDIKAFSLYMEQLTRARVPLLQALSSAQKACSPLFQVILNGIIYNVSAGAQCSQAFKAYPFIFDEISCALLQLGEASGMLKEAFHGVHRYVHQKQQWQLQKKRALRYPMIVLCFMLMALVGLFMTLVPSLLGFLTENNIEIPLSTRILIGLWDHKETLCGVIGASLGAFIGVYRVWPRLRFACHYGVLRLKGVGPLLETLFLSRALTAASLLLDYATSVVAALKLAGQLTSNMYLKRSFEEIAGRIEQGESLAQAWQEYFPKQITLVEAMRIGESSGSLAVMLKELGQLYGAQASESMDKLLTWLQPMALGVVGLLMLWITTALLLPLYQHINLMNAV